MKYYYFKKDESYISNLDKSNISASIPKYDLVELLKDLDAENEVDNIDYTLRETKHLIQTID